MFGDMVELSSMQTWRRGWSTMTTWREGERIRGTGREIHRGWQTASNNKLLVIGRRSGGGLVKPWVEERASPLHATNWLKYLRNWHDNRITWLCTVVARDPDAHPLIPSSAPPFSPPHCPVSLLSVLHSLVSLSLSLSVILCSVLHDLPYKRQIRVIKRRVARHAHCSRRPCNFRFDVLPVLFADRLPIRPSRLFNLSADFCGEIVAVPVYESRMIFYKYVRLEFFDRPNLRKIL